MPLVVRTISLPVPAARAWDLIGDFAAVDRWMPGIDRLELRGGPPGTPEVERVVHSGGMEFVERLVAVDDAAMRMVYSMPDPPFPIADHQATLAVTADPGGGCTVSWSARFEADDGVVEAVDEQMGTGAFQVGLDALAKWFDRAGRTS
ncbi:MULTISPECIES: SRPBCC family protein [Actinomadura]|uniref:SRPBCC family protein n=1 Tax=Actinomadura TaxID=1988 RepID=UPI0003AD09FF|nr:SRPBCC family protein [Actinomadura madurae]